MTHQPFIQVAPAPVKDMDPTQAAHALERYLATMSLTQTGLAAFEIHVTPEATRVLRDTLRTGRMARETLQQIEAIQAHTLHRVSEQQRELRRQVMIWIVAALAFWAWAIWVSGA